jgi:Tol biopolymer transport system component
MRLVTAHQRPGAPRPRSFRRAIFALVTVPAVVLAGCSDGPTAPSSMGGPDAAVAAAQGGSAAPLPAPGRIVYSGEITGDYEIYSIDPDGSDPRRLTNSFGIDFSPVVSPNGKKIAFVSLRTGTLEIYAMNVDGSGVRQLTALGGSAREPAWSPDGRQIAFAWGSAATGYDIHVMNASGSGVRRLTTDPSEDRHPSWSPDGRRIAFSSDRSGSHNVYIMNADGTGATSFTTCSANCADPAWSPDGTQIAYADGQNGDGTRIVTVERVDHTRTLHFATHDLDEGPNWSPDGVRLTYAAYVFCQGCAIQTEVFTIGADGSGEQRLTSTFGREFTPSWGR